MFLVEVEEGEFPSPIGIELRSLDCQAIAPLTLLDMVLVRCNFAEFENMRNMHVHVY